jgi:hypothetical protein
MEIKATALSHFKELQAALKKIDGAEAYLNVATFVVEVRLGSRVYKLLPMFLLIQGGRAMFTTRPSPNDLMFAGWRPYFNRPIPEIGKKKSFKAFLQKHELRHPASSNDAPRQFDFLVKRDISSFGMDIRGPFRAGTEVTLDTNVGEFYEQFVPGEILKIWFHNADPVCLEIRPMPTVTGDGSSTIRELAAARIPSRRRTLDFSVAWSVVEQVVAYRGRTLETVLEKGERQMIDYSYSSPFMGSDDNIDVLTPLKEKGAEPLPMLGQSIWSNLPESWHTTAVYAVDAIRDADGRLYFLEVNFNPLVHPAVYPAMISVLPAFPDFHELRFVPVVGE